MTTPDPIGADHPINADLEAEYYQQRGFGPGRPTANTALAYTEADRQAAYKAGWDDARAVIASPLDVEGLLAELAESPLPGARYAYEVVKRHLAKERP